MKTNHLTVILFLTFLECIPNRFVEAIKCYRCVVAPVYTYNDSIGLCEDFDYSNKFIINCPYSTFCMKKISSAKIPVPINGIDRDCAIQKLETQVYKNGKWETEITIEEPYTEGCLKVNDKGQRTSNIEYCYCRGELCNSSQQTSLGLFSLFASVIIMLFL